MTVAERIRMMKSTANIPERIKKRRTELGLSQDELAKRLGYKSRSSINKLEQGKADIPRSKILVFSKALSCSPSYLLGLETEEQFKRNDTSYQLSVK